MSMYEQAEKLNTNFKQLFNSIPIEHFTTEQRELILDLIVRFGAIAKFRCRSNTAYDNFVNTTFKEIATFERIKFNDESDFTILKSKIE